MSHGLYCTCSSDLWTATWNKVETVIENMNCAWHRILENRHSNAPTTRVHQNVDIWCFWWMTRHRRLNLVIFWDGWSRGGTGRPPGTSVAGFTGKLAPQRWWRTPGAGYAKIVPAGDKVAAGVAPMPHAHFVGQGGGALPIGNRLFAVAATTNATTRSWHAHGVRDGPWFLAVMQRCLDTHLHELGTLRCGKKCAYTRVKNGPV